VKSANLWQKFIGFVCPFSFKLLLNYGAFNCAACMDLLQFLPVNAN